MIRDAALSVDFADGVAGLRMQAAAAAQGEVVGEISISRAHLPLSPSRA